MDFAHWLRSVRLNAGLSQEKLSAAVRELDPQSRVYQGRITNWELSKDLPDLRQLTLVGLVLKLSPEDVELGRSLWEAAELAGLPGHDSSAELSSKPAV